MGARGRGEEKNGMRRRSRVVGGRGGGPGGGGNRSSSRRKGRSGFGVLVELGVVAHLEEFGLLGMVRANVNGGHYCGCFVFMLMMVRANMGKLNVLPQIYQNMIYFYSKFTFWIFCMKKKQG